jgi:hypothetical protein
VSRPLRTVLSAVFVLGLLSPDRLSAQAVYGSIVGSIVDASGAAVVGAKVTIRNAERDVANSTTTNESGNYTQRYLIVGRYQVRVEAAGFQTFVQDNVGVSVDSEARVDIRLQVGEVTQTLEVSAEASLLKTERSDVSTTYNQKAVAELPTLSRRFTNFQLMTPGVSLWPVSLTAAQPENPQGSHRLLVNGQSLGLWCSVTPIIRGGRCSSTATRLRFSWPITSSAAYFFRRAGTLFGWTSVQSCFTRAWVSVRSCPCCW